MARSKVSQTVVGDTFRELRSPLGPASTDLHRKSQSASVSIHVNRWQWLQTLASECGPPSATTRHVLHAISVHMNAQGESAWPSKETLATRTGLSERAVTKHVSLARADRWIEVTTRMNPGRGWRVNQYRATVPDHLIDRVPKVKKHTERGSPRSAQHTKPQDKTYGTSGQNTPNDVPTNSPLNISKNVDPDSDVDCDDKTPNLNNPDRLAALKKVGLIG